MGNGYVNEGFLQFQKSATSNDNVNIPEYSPTAIVNKLYDQIFYDQNNGNLIEVVSPNDQTLNGNVDLTGNTITGLIVTNRHGASNLYNIAVSGTAQITQDSLTSTVQNNMYSWSYPSQTTTTDIYNVFYIPWYDSTYIYMLNKTTNLQLGAWLYGPQKTTQQWICNSTNNVINIATQVPDRDIANGTIVGDTYYDPLKQLYQISHNVKFDYQNGNLIIQTGTGTTKSITIWDRTGKPSTPIVATGTVSNTVNTMNSVLFKPFTVVDTAGQNLVVYMPSDTKTVIALITLNGSNQYILANVCRFKYGINGIDLGDGLIDDNEYDDDDDVKCSGKTNNSFVYDNSGGTGYTDANINKQYWNPDDYMLKTQIIPPVCPSCPACPACPAIPNSTICTNCGGNGGSGTLASNGNSSVGGVLNNAVNTTGNVFDKTFDTAGNVINKTVDTAGNVIEKTVDSAGNVIGGVVSGVGNVVGGVASGVGNVVGGVASGVGNVVGGVASGVGNVVGGVASGVGNVVGGLQQNNQSQTNRENGQHINYNTVPVELGTKNQYADNYSYYGQLPAKKSTDFMPVTTSFSAFGK